VGCTRYNVLRQYQVDHPRRYLALRHHVKGQEINVLQIQKENLCLASRRQVMASLAACASLVPYAAKADDNTPTDSNTKQVVVQTLPSGVKVIDLKEGTGPYPAYGQLVSISYKGYVRVGSSEGSKGVEPPMFEQVSNYLIKHGNGRIIPGLDEGLHTMRVGGSRRIIIPPKLGYVETGLGPVPESFYARFQLNRLLDEMVQSRNGRLIFEVEMLSAFDDEADQGYYGDKSLSPDQFNTLRQNIERSQREAKAAGAGSPLKGPEV